MSDRRTMTPQDWAVTAMSVGICILVGAVLMTLVALLFQGFWVFAVLAIPFLIAQLLFEGVLRGIWYGGRKLLGFTPKETPPEPVPDPTIPWLRAYSGWIGIAIGAGAAALFGDIWRVFP